VLMVLDLRQDVASRRNRQRTVMACPPGVCGNRTRSPLRSPVAGSSRAIGGCEQLDVIQPALPVERFKEGGWAARRVPQPSTNTSREKLSSWIDPAASEQAFAIVIDRRPR